MIDKLFIVGTLAAVLLYSKATGMSTLEIITARQQAYDLIKSREGYRTIVYRDTTGNLTGGIGHKILASDNLQYNQNIPPEKIKAWYEADFNKAFSAAQSQVAELGKNSVALLVALSSVNFQLGTGWRSKFPNTWTMLKRGDWQNAINGLNRSAWADQTPKRVADFVSAIKTTYA